MKNRIEQLQDVKKSHRGSIIFFSIFIGIICIVTYFLHQHATNEGKGIILFMGGLFMLFFGAMVLHNYQQVKKCEDKIENFKEKLS